MSDVLARRPPVNLRRLRYASALTALPIRTESAPYGSCHLQAVSNLLAFSGVQHAPEHIGLSFGASRTADAVLTGGDRWIHLARETFGVNLAERHAADIAAASAVETEALAGGAPVAAVVDSFHLPSPHTGRRHLPHCVLLVTRDDSAVTVIDPMNQPAPTQYEIAAWNTMRSAACVDRFRMFTCPGRARRRPSAGELLRAVQTDIAVHHAGDARELAGFLAWAQGTASLTFDVAGVAAERAYLAALLGNVAAQHSWLRGLADTVASLARRWYLLHSLGLAQPDATGPQRNRLISLLRSTADTDTRTARALCAVKIPPAPEEP